ncbi:MAG: exodeoxyribonuclease III [Brevinema sp.]
MKTFISWNINGIRAATKKGFLDWLYKCNPDVLGVQEIKAEPHQLESPIHTPEGRTTYWNPSRTKKGYSGTALFSRQEPQSIKLGWGEEIYDQEGRTIMADYGDFVFFTIYFPNGESSPERLQYKLDFYDSFLEYIIQLKKEGRSIIFSGDVNTAHTEIDLARPKENKNTSGFLPIERSWIDRVIQAGFVDTFRYIHPQAVDQYSWWSYRAGARERNVGWRIDYIFVSEDLLPKLKDAFILYDVHGSDHCPVGITIDL